MGSGWLRYGDIHESPAPEDPHWLYRLPRIQGSAWVLGSEDADVVELNVLRTGFPEGSGLRNRRRPCLTRHIAWSPVEIQWRQPCPNTACSIGGRPGQAARLPARCLFQGRFKTSTRLCVASHQGLLHSQYKPHRCRKVQDSGIAERGCSFS